MKVNQAANVMSNTFIGETDGIYTLYALNYSLGDTKTLDTVYVESMKHIFSTSAKVRIFFNTREEQLIRTAFPNLISCVVVDDLHHIVLEETNVWLVYIKNGKLINTVLLLNQPPKSHNVDIKSSISSTPPISKNILTNTPTIFTETYPMKIQMVESPVYSIDTIDVDFDADFNEFFKQTRKGK